MSLVILFHFLCAQHVSDINISIIRGLRLFCWITALVVLFLVRCVLEFRCGWVGVVSVFHYNTHRTKNNTTNVAIQQNSRKLLMMDILMSETFWGHKKWNKIASDMKFIFYLDFSMFPQLTESLVAETTEYRFRSPIELLKSGGTNLLPGLYNVYLNK